MCDIQSSENSLILICGYRRTGKDTLYSILATNQTSVDRFKWRIYKHPDQIGRKMKSDKNTIYERTSFADNLKCEASKVYGIPQVVSESDKDLKQFIHYKTGELVSARDIHIEWGAIRRSEDPNYWCKAALKHIPKPSQTQYETGSDTSTVNYVVTDWRFRNESKYALDNYDNVLTIRVYRSDVPEPPSNVESEHDLDTYRTHFLLLNDELKGEFLKVIEKFPQYSDYIPCESI